MSKSFVAALLLLASTASADNIVATGETEQHPWPRGIDGRLGMLLGGADVGDADGFSVGISGALGYRIADVTLRGMFDYYKVGDGSDEIMQRHGRAIRIGGAVRYSFANNGPDSTVVLDFWGELGGGWEHVDWRVGGILDRPSVEAAFGFDVGGRSNRDRLGRRREIGYFMAFRSLVGQGPEVPGPAVCGGPCTMATKPSRTDVSMFFELGIHWGR